MAVEYQKFRSSRPWASQRRKLHRHCHCQCRRLSTLCCLNWVFIPFSWISYSDHARELNATWTCPAGMKQSPRALTRMECTRYISSSSNNSPTAHTGKQTHMGPRKCLMDVIKKQWRRAVKIRFAGESLVIISSREVISLRLSTTYTRALTVPQLSTVPYRGKDQIGNPF